MIMSKNTKLEILCFCIAALVAVAVHWGVCEAMSYDASVKPGASCPFLLKQ